jgi:hypothetical protein
MHLNGALVFRELRRFRRPDPASRAGAAPPISLEQSDAEGRRVGSTSTQMFVSAGTSHFGRWRLVSLPALKFSGALTHGPLQ